MSEQQRKRFVTTIKPDILLEFKIACTKQQSNMNEILEQLMELYVKGEIELKENAK